MLVKWTEEALDHRNALLYAMGVSEEEARHPVIGIINAWNEWGEGMYVEPDLKFGHGYLDAIREVIVEM